MPLRKRMNRLLMLPRDPRFIREFKAKYCVEVFAEHVPTKKKYVQCFSASVKEHADQLCFHRRKLWRRKDQGKFTYPYQE